MSDDRFFGILIAVGVLLLLAMLGTLIIVNNVVAQPACQEDEAIWWVGNDQRGCVNIDTLIIMESQHTNGG